MPDVADAAARDDPLQVVLTAVGSALDDCEHVLSGAPDRSAAMASEFARFLRAELPRLLEDWQMRRLDDPPGETVQDQPAGDRPIRMRRPATLRGHTAAVKDVAFSPDGATLASADDRGVVRLWDARTGRRAGKLGRRDLGMGIMSLAFSPDAGILAAAAPALTLWDLTSAAAATLPTQTRFDRVWSVAYGPAGDLVATGNSHDSVHLWNPRTRRKIMTLAHPGTVFAVALSSDGATLASGGGRDNNVLVWDIRTGQCRHALTDHTGTIHALAFSPDGQILASASYDRTVRVWDVRTGHAIATSSPGDTGHPARPPVKAQPIGYVNPDPEETRTQQVSCDIEDSATHVADLLQVAAGLAPAGCRCSASASCSAPEASQRRGTSRADGWRSLHHGLVTKVPELRNGGIILDAHNDSEVAAHVAGEDEETARRFGWWPAYSTEETVRAGAAPFTEIRGRSQSGRPGDAQRP